MDCWEEKLCEFALDDDAVNVKYCAQHVNARLFQLKHANLLQQVVERHGLCESAIVLADRGLVLMHAWAAYGGWYAALHSKERVIAAMQEPRLKQVPLCFIIAHHQYSTELLLESIRKGFATEIHSSGASVNIVHLLVAMRNWEALEAILQELPPDSKGQLPLDHLSSFYFRGRTVPLCRPFHDLWFKAFQLAKATPNYSMEELLARFLVVDTPLLSPAIDQICKLVCREPLDLPLLFERLNNPTDAIIYRLMHAHPNRETLADALQQTEWFRRREELDALFEA